MDIGGGADVVAIKETGSRMIEPPASENIQYGYSKLDAPLLEVS